MGFFPPLSPKVDSHPFGSHHAQALASASSLVRPAEESRTFSLVELLGQCMLGRRDPPFSSREFFGSCH